MEDNSCISGISTIGDPISESGYGRCITLWIISCDPPAESLSVRLGGPGSQWHAIALPMEQPLTVQCSTSKSVRHCTTELAIATPSYVESPAAISDEIHPSCDMVAMDVLTNTASAAAGSTIIATVADSASEAEGNALTTEILAAAGAGSEGEASLAPLHVYFRFSLGVLLAGDPMPAAAAEDGAAQTTSPTLSGNLSISVDEKEGRLFDAHCGDADAGNLQHAGNADDAPTLPLASHRTPSDEEDSTHEQRTLTAKSSVTTAKPFIDADVEHSSQRSGVGTEGDVHSTYPPSPVPLVEPSSSCTRGHAAADVQPGRGGPAPSPSRGTILTPRLVLSHDSNGTPNNTKDTKALPSGNREHTPHQHGGSSNISDSEHSSSQSNTLRRQRPRNARRSIVQMDLAPMMEDAAEPENSEGENGEAAVTTEDSVYISDDCEEDMPPQERRHRPSSPPVAEVEVPGVEQAPLSSSASDQRSKRAHSPEHKQEDSPPTIKLHPSTENLFEGVESSELLVAVAVVAVVNTKSTADPHRIVSVSVKAGVVTSDEADSTTASTECVAFQTAPTLRSLAAVVPQMSVPVLLRPPSLRSSKAEDEADAKKGEENTKVAVQLHVTCTVTESMISGGTSTSTVLWAATAFVDPADMADLSSASPATKKVSFHGANGDTVVTQWTYITVGAYRDATLNFRCRVDEPGKPTLQLLLIADGTSSSRKKSSRSHPALQTSVAAHVWVCTPGSKASTTQHRLAAAATVQSLVQQPLHVALQDSLGYIAVHVPQHHHAAETSSIGSHVEPLFIRGFSVEWSRATVLKHAAVTLYYRIVAPSASLALPTLAPQLPSLFHNTKKQLEALGDDSSKVLRELIVTVKPLSPLLTNVFTASHYATPHTAPQLPQEGAEQPATATKAAATSLSPFVSSWSIVLRHAVTHAVLMESAATTTAESALTYRCFLPMLSEGLSSATEQQRNAPGSAVDAALALHCLPWELVLVPGNTTSLHTAPLPTPPPTPPASRVTYRNSRSATHAAALASKRYVASANSTPAWSGAMFLSQAQLYAAAPVPGTTTSFKTTLCVSAPSASAMSLSALQTAAKPLGAQLEVCCDVRQHSLDAQSAVFCLRSLRLIPSPLAVYSAAAPSYPPTPQVSVPASQVRLWFTTSGSSAEELQSSWSASSSGRPSVSDLQHAWAPEASSPYASSSSPPLRVDTHGQFVSIDAPVLLSTVNTRARLCVAVVPDSAGAAAQDSLPQRPSSNAAMSAANEEEALRRRVAAVRKRAIHRYARAEPTPGSKGGEGGGGADKEQRSSPEPAVAEMFLQCLNAVAMRVENYAEVDLQASLVAASERQGHSRHRLLLSSVSGIVRLSHSMVLELKGQWVKLPRKVAQVSDLCTPSPRLWALRCSCVVRRTGDKLHGVTQKPTHSAAITDDDRVPLAQEVLEAECGYDVTVRSIPLGYGDPTEDMVQRLLPGVSYGRLVVHAKEVDRSSQPFRETIAISTAASTQEEPAMPAATSDLLEHLFGPTGVAHNAYISDASHKVAVVHFVFGDAYTTRTVLSVTCASGEDVATATSPKLHERKGNTPLPLYSSSSPAIAHTRSSPAHASPTVQIVCDSLTRSSTLHSFLPEATVAQLFQGVSRHRYPPELTWYHGSLAIAADVEQQRREKYQAAWQRGLTEQSLGSQQRPGPLVVSAVAHHPYDSLPLLVECSLTRCFEGRYLFVFGGTSTVTGAASSRAFTLDLSSQKWLALKMYNGSHRNSNSSVISPRHGHSAVFRPSDGALYVFGGRDHRESNRHSASANESGSTARCSVLSDVWKLEWSIGTATVVCTELVCSVAEPSSFSNTSSAPMAKESGGGIAVARWRHAALLHDDYLVVLGGLSGSGTCCSCRELLYLDMRTHEWSVRRSFGNDAPSPRYGHVAAISDSTSLYVFGGWTTVGGDGAVKSGASCSDGENSPNGGGADARGTVAVADFYKMDLITRTWSRVEPNGTLRPPALELAEMTACELEGCSILFLVGGITTESASAPAPNADASASTQLEVFLFSPATLFWRCVKMDCTPVPARFGLRAVAIPVASTSTAAATTPNGSGKYASTAQDSTRLRRSLPTRGQHLGDVVIVGGLPLDEAAIVGTSPAITLLLSAGNGGPCQRTVEAFRPSSGMQQHTSQLRSVSRGPVHLDPRRPASGPPRTTPRRPMPLALIRASQQQQQQHRDADQDKDCCEGLLIASSARSPRSLAKFVNRVHSASTPGRRAGCSANTIFFNPERPSCYSTLTWQQQRQLVRRLYTDDLQVRAAHREALEEQVYFERTTPMFQHRRNRSRSRSPGVPTMSAAQPARVHSAPSQRTAYGMTQSATPIATGSAETERETAPALAIHRGLRSAFFMCSDSSVIASSSPSSSLSLSSSARAASREAQHDSDEESSTQSSLKAISKGSAGAEHCRADEDAGKSPIDESEVEKTESDSEEDSALVAAAAEPSTDSNRSIASSTTTDSNDNTSEDMEAAQPVVHTPLLPAHVPAKSQGSAHHVIAASASVETLSADTSSRNVLGVTPEVEKLSEHTRTSSQSTVSPSRGSTRSAHTEDEEHEEHVEATVQEEGAKPPDLSSSRSTSVAAFGDKNNAEDEDEAGKRSLGASIHSNAAPPLPVLPMASETNDFTKSKSDRASDVSAAPSCVSAATHGSEEADEGNPPSQQHHGALWMHSEQQPPETATADNMADNERSDSAPASHNHRSSNAAAWNTPAFTEGLGTPPNDERKEDQTDAEGVAEEYGGDDWESLSGGNEKQEASRDVKASAVAQSEDEVPATVVGSGDTPDDQKRYEEDLLMPPPAPREHPTPPESPTSSLLDSVPPSPVALAQNSTSYKDAVEALATSDSEMKNQVDLPNVHTPTTAEVSEVRDEEPPEAASEVMERPGGHKVSSETSSEIKEKAAEPVEALSAVSSEAYDDDFSDEVEEQRASAPAASVHSLVGEDASLVEEALSPPASGSRNVQPSAERGAQGTLTTTLPSTVSSEAPEDVVEAHEKPPNASSDVLEDDDDFSDEVEGQRASASAASVHSISGEEGDAVPIDVHSIDEVERANGGNEEKLSFVHTPMGQISDPREEPSVEVPGEQQQRSSMASSLREQIEDEELEILPHTAEMRSGCANARTKEESEAAEELPPVEPYTPISSLSEGSASKEEQRADDAADVTAHSATSEESDAKKKEAEVEAVDSPRPSAPPTPVGGPREFTASVFSEQKEEAYVVVPTSDKGIEDRLRGASVAQSENSLSAVPLTPGDEAQQPASGAESHQDRLDQIEGAEEQMLNSSVAPPSVHNAPVEEPEVERSAHEVDAVDAPAVADAARFELPSESPSSLETSAESTETSDKAEDAEAAQAVPVALTVSVSQQLSNHSASQLLDEEEPHSTTSEAIDASEPPLPAQEAAPEQDGSNEHVTAALRAAAAALCDDSLAFMPAPTPLLVIENEKEKVKEGETQVELPSVDSASNGALETPPAGSDLVQEQSDAQEAHEKRAGDAHDAAAIAETSARKMDDEGPAVPREPAEIETGEERHEMSSPSEGASVASEKEEEMSEAAAAPALDEDARRPVLSPLDYTAESFEASEHALKPSEDVERPFDEEDMKEQESEAVAVTQPPVMPLHGEISELTEGEFSGTASLVAFASEAGAVEGVAAAPEASAPPDPLDEPTPSPLPPYPSTNEGGPFVPHEAPEAPSYHCTIEAAEEEVEEDASFHADGVAPHAHEGDEHQLSADVVDTSSDVDEIELSSSAIASEQEEEVAEHPQTPSPASTPAQEAETLHGISMPTGSESALSADAPPSSTGSDYTVNAFAKHASASSCIDEGDAPAHENEAEGEMLDLKGVGVPSADPPAAATAPEGCDEEREDMDFTPTASSHDDLPALVAEGVPSPFGNAEDENEHFVDTEDLGGGKHTAAPKMGVDDWEEELSALPAATTPETSDDEEAETLHMALNSGRDLLDRRRGVEEEVQDDDFDF